MPDVAAKLAVAIVADQQVDDAVLRLCLQRQLAVLALEQRSQQGSDRQRFGQEVADRRGIGVGRKDRV